MVLDADAAADFLCVMFIWGAMIYLDAFHAPEDAGVIYGIGKQWMWKFQHPEGQREINTLHVPVGSPVKMLLTSEDVIHSFFVPAFRSSHGCVAAAVYLGVVSSHTRPASITCFARNIAARAIPT